MKKAIQMWSFRDRIHDGESLATKESSLPEPLESRRNK